MRSTQRAWFWRPRVEQRGASRLLLDREHAHHCVAGARSPRRVSITSRHVAWHGRVAASDLLSCARVRRSRTLLVADMVQVTSVLAVDPGAPRASASVTSWYQRREMPRRAVSGSARGWCRRREHGVHAGVRRLHQLRPSHRSETKTDRRERQVNSRCGPRGCSVWPSRISSSALVMQCRALRLGAALVIDSVEEQGAEDECLEVQDDPQEADRHRRRRGRSSMVSVTNVMAVSRTSAR